MNEVSVQLRHKRFGVFQGEFLGMCFWWPESEMPEQGICELTEDVARELIKAHMYEKSIGNEVNQGIEECEFSIEPFDALLHAQLIAVGTGAVTERSA